jgi:RND superfamily putative drug exporter
MAVLAGWGVLLLATWLAAPPWDEVAQDREFAFLPEDAPSRRAEAVFAQAFPEDHLASSIVLVLSRAGSSPGQLQSDLKFIEDDLYPSLRQIAEAEGGLASERVASDEPLFDGEGSAPPAPRPKKRSIIARIRTPNAPGAGALLVSPDRRALLVVVELATEFLSKENWPTITRVEDLALDLKQKGKVPPGMDVSLTGSAVIGRDHTQAELQSVRATGLLTVLLVIGLLVLIYRAPLLALIPLATVYLAVQVALNLLAILAGAGYLTLFQGIQIYITILAYGAGVDYCLFLMARYREALDRGASPPDAVAGAVGGVGAALVASAATVACGIGMMYFAQFGKFREAGLAIPLSLVLVLLATLTFSPSLLRLAGRWAFWPRRVAAAGDGHAPAARGSLGGLFAAGELHRIWERVGQMLLRRAGTIWLVTVLVMAPFVVIAALCYDRLSYDLISELPADAPSVAGTRVLQQHFPAGVMGPVAALVVNDRVDFGTAQGRALVEQLTSRLSERKGELGLADVRSLTSPLGTTDAAQQAFTGLDVPKEAREEGERRAAREYYIGDVGKGTRNATRLDLVLAQNPFAQASLADLDQIEQAVRDALPTGARAQCQLYFAGTTASVRDLTLVMQSDRTRIELLVLASVLVILVLLLRRIAVSLYLLLSVLFSYYTTLGVAFLVLWLLDPSGFTGIDWKVGVFLFTILVAVGEDYNILLMTRVDEEEREHGPVRGVTEALDRTGPIISSCGIIMAGTFGSLLAGSLTEMKQLGFALAFGVLLDTFIVRPILVPAFLIWRRRGGLAPWGWTRKGGGSLGPSRQGAEVERA